MIHYLSLTDAVVMIRCLRPGPVVRDAPWALKPLIRALEARANYTHIQNLR
jgi:hypothetical protein